MIPQDYIQEVIRRTDITDLVGGYVNLKHRGRTHTGLCPFHNEKTPSFVVYPETQSFYCFGCGVGGDAITFVKRINNLDYVEAVRFLASRAGMPMPEEDDKAGRLRSRILSANKDAARFYYQQLNADTEEARLARRYWRGRGLSDDTIRRFGLGYAPDGFSTGYKFLRSKGYTDEELLEAGLIKRSQKGNLYDAFFHRVMTPIFDVKGSLIAFGGRVLDDSKPKYVNSPETLVYKKSRTMFALNLAKKSASKRYILCEGYMDVISMHQAGFDTAVCACGTALTPEQVKLLSEYAEEVVLCYDSDEAGQKATARSLELFASSPLRVRVLKIPGAKDPDEFIKKYGKERFAALFDKADNALEYKLAKIRDKYDIAQDSGRVQYIKEAIGLLAGPISETERDVYAGRLAEETDVRKESILNQLDGAIRQNRRRASAARSRELLQEGTAGQIHLPYGPDGAKALGVANAEQQLVAALLKSPEFLPRVMQRIRPEQFLMEDMRQSYEAICRCAREGAAPSLSALAQELDDKLVSTLSQMLARNHDVSPSPADLEMYMDRMEQSVPKSSQAGKMSNDEIENYLTSILNKKQKKN